MKQLILIIFIALGLQSCNSIFTNKPLIIKTAKKFDRGGYVYELETFGINIHIYSNYNQFNVGDTIYLTKNKQ